MDFKYLSYAGLKRFFYTKILKLINLKIDKTNGDISNTKVRSVDTISTEFPDPVAGENTKTFLGKVKKCLADWKAIKSTLLTLSMLTNQYENSTSKIPTVALVYALKQTTDGINSNLSNALMLRGYASGDANNYSQTGIYQIISAEGSTMLNLGFKGPCIFLVYATSNYIAQEQIYSDGSLKRFKNSAGEWSTWK